jgi:hypothetical protein
MKHGTRKIGMADEKGIKPAPRKKGPVKKPPDRPLPMPDAAL